MILVYLDESGNTGSNLADKEQPVFVLCALMVPENLWKQVESDLAAAAAPTFGSPLPDDFEIHATDLRSGRGMFKGVSVDERLAVQAAWFDVARRNGLKVIYRSIKEASFAKWVHANFGDRGRLDPFLAAFPLVAQVVDQAVGDANLYPPFEGAPNGVRHAIFIADENAGVAPDVEKSARLLRGDAGSISLRNVIEKVFFIDSKKSLPLQLCDLCALSARKTAEREAGMPPRSVDDAGIEALASLIYKGDERTADVLRWLRGRRDEAKGEATRG